MYYTQSVKTVLKTLETDETLGLSAKEAQKRLLKYGSNTLPIKKKPPIFFKFVEQFKDFLILVLLAATLVSFLLGEWIDAIAIASIVLINSIIGFVQEIQAEKTLESLKEKDILYALVERDGSLEKIPNAEVVPGDIVILEEGSLSPADVRLCESYSLRVDESILTGESHPATKNWQAITPKEVPLADRVNMVYKDTVVVAGRGKAVVVATGQSTEMGKIASSLEETIPPKTLLTVELEKVGTFLTKIIGVIVLFMFLINILKNVPFVENLLTSIALAVAAIPEGLPAIVTIVLSLGVKRLADKKTIVKKLMAGETLGAVKIIATDKTGTLTQNKINVTNIILPNGEEFSVVGEGYLPKGSFFDKNKKITDPEKNPGLVSLLRIGVLASNAKINHYQVIGDTTEGALVVASQRAGLNDKEINSAEPRLFEVPFSAERKMMSVAVQINATSDHFLYSKGAPEEILKRCKITSSQQKAILETTQQLAQKGLRSLAVAQKKLTITEVKNLLEKDKLEEKEMTYLGLFGMQDPLRPEVKEALSQAKLAGIRTIMITGDHKVTALSIAREAGIVEKNETVLTENEVQEMTINELAQEIKNGVNVFARISPLGKLKIVQAIKSLPNTPVAVTGDGVNDAAALQAANIGVAMGQTGTDVTREVADVVITDDNYATIIDAVREGRVIFANLVKFIRYLISCNISEVIVVASAVVFGLPPPLLPIQILWINLITDGPPALALGVDPPEKDIMRKPPRDLSTPLLHRKRWMYMLIEGSMIGLTVFVIYLVTLNKWNYQVAQTITFASLSMAQLVHAFNNRSTRKSLFTVGVFTNKILVATVFFSIILQILVIHSSFGRLVFKTVALDTNQWLIIALAAIFPFILVEIKKQLRFRILP